MLRRVERLRSKRKVLDGSVKVVLDVETMQQSDQTRALAPREMRRRETSPNERQAMLGDKLVVQRYDEPRIGHGGILFVVVQKGKQTMIFLPLR